MAPASAPACSSRAAPTAAPAASTKWPGILPTAPLSPKRCATRSSPPANQRELLPFVRNFKALYPGKTVWCYSGYTLEQLLGQEPSRCRCEATDPLLSLLDVLVDGPFVQAEYDISLRFRGSANQRLLDMPRTLAAGKPVLWQDKPVFSTHTMP